MKHFRYTTELRWWILLEGKIFWRKKFFLKKVFNVTSVQWRAAGQNFWGFYLTRFNSVAQKYVLSSEKTDENLCQKDLSFISKFSVMWKKKLVGKIFSLGGKKIHLRIRGENWWKKSTENMIEVYISLPKHIRRRCP